MKLEEGQAYYVETVSKYWIGRLVSVDGPYTVTLTDVCWVPDTGRFHEFLANGRASANTEFEPAPRDCRS